MSPWLLAIHVDPDSDKLRHMDPIRELDRREADEIESAEEFLALYFAAPDLPYFMRKSEEVFTAYESLERALSSTPSTFTIEPIVHELRMRFAEFLLAKRVYLEHLETRIKRQDGTSSLRWAAHSARKAREFDSSWGYAVAYALRNFCHVEFPGAFHSTASLDEDEMISTTVDYFIRRDETIARGDFTRSQVEAFLRCPPEIPVLELVGDATNAVGRVHASDMAVCLPRAKNHLAKLQRYVSEAKADAHSTIAVASSDPRSGKFSLPVTVGRTWNSWIGLAEQGSFRVHGPWGTDYVLEGPPAAQL